MRIWKLIASLVLVGALASAAFASASKLNVISQGLQAGGADVRGCQGAAPVNMSYTTQWNPSTSSFLVDTVTVNGINPACVTAAAPTTIQVVLTFAAPPGSFQDLGAVSITGPTVVYSIPVALQPDAANLTDMHMLIK